MSEPLNQYRETAEETLQPIFSNEVLRCADCHHIADSHYWNGGGNQANSGYDACKTAECNCTTLYESRSIENYAIPAEYLNRLEAAAVAYANQRVVGTLKEVVCLSTNGECSLQFIVGDGISDPLGQHIAKIEAELKGEQA